MSTFVCFAESKSTTISYKYEEIKGCNTSQLTEKFKISQKILAIHTPFFIPALQSDIIPVEEYPKLEVNKRYSKYDRPEYFLTTLLESEKQTESILVTPKNQTTLQIPAFYVAFNLVKFENLTAQDVKQQIIDSLGFSVHDANITIDDEQIPNDTNATKLIERAKKENLIINFEINDSTQKKLNKRQHIVEEIMSTEQTYINDLTTINDLFMPKISPILNNDDRTLIFRDIPGILACHNQFLSGLKENGTSYSSQLATTFLDFSKFFGVSQNYISNFTAIDNKVSQYNKNPNCQSID